MHTPSTHRNPCKQSSRDAARETTVPSAWGQRIDDHTARSRRSRSCGESFALQPGNEATVTIGTSQSEAPVAPHTWLTARDACCEYQSRPEMTSGRLRRKSFMKSCFNNTRGSCVRPHHSDAASTHTSHTSITSNAPSPAGTAVLLPQLLGRICLGNQCPRSPANHHGVKGDSRAAIGHVFLVPFPDTLQRR